MINISHEPYEDSEVLKDLRIRSVHTSGEAIFQKGSQKVGREQEESILEQLLSSSLSAIDGQVIRPSVAIKQSGMATTPNFTSPAVSKSNSRDHFSQRYDLLLLTFGI